MGRMAEQAQEQDERENLSGNDMFKFQRWEEEMHTIAIGIEAEGFEWKKRMDNLKENQNG